MNNPNPFIPQGTLLDQRNKKRTRVKYAVLAIFACNILLVGPLLLNGGCRRSDTTDNQTPPDTGTAVAADTGAALPPPSVVSSNTAPSTDSLANVQTPPTPPPQVTQPTPPPAAETDYVIVKGDTLASIAAKNHIKLKDLEAANPGIDPKKLAINKSIKIPAGGNENTAMATASDTGDVYVVKSGDTLSKIATAHHTTYKEIMALNNLKTTAIKVNDKLKMPSAAPTASAPMETTSGATTTTASNPSAATPVIR